MEKLLLDLEAKEPTLSSPVGIVHHPYCMKHTGEDPNRKAPDTEMGEEDNQESSDSQYDYNHPERP